MSDIFDHAGDANAVPPGLHSTPYVPEAAEAAPLALALAAMVSSIDRASPGALRAARQYAREQVADFSQPAGQRATWVRVVTMLGQNLK